MTTIIYLMIFGIGLCSVFNACALEIANKSPGIVTVIVPDAEDAKKVFKIGGVTHPEYGYVSRLIDREFLTSRAVAWVPDGRQFPTIKTSNKVYVIVPIKKQGRLMFYEYPKNESREPLGIRQLAYKFSCSIGDSKKSPVIIINKDGILASLACTYDIEP